jgi:hypothetical protein
MRTEMKISTKPTSLVLVGILFICIFLTPALAEPQPSGLEQLNKLKEHSLQKSSDYGILKVGADTISFPWYGRQTLPMRPALSGSILTSKEEILMNSSHSMANLQDLSAINSLNQRDLLYKDSQNGDPNFQGLANSQDISVSGKGNDKSNLGWQEDGIGNYLSIDVHDISVSAVNTMKGGSAVATSNIIIEPVQIIVCPSEVEEKLK